MDEMGDANQTLVWVTHRTTGRGIQTMIGQSHNGQNSRRAANVERGVGQPSIVYRKRRVYTETVGGIAHGSVPCLRPMDRIVRRLVVTFRRATQIGLRRLEYSERLTSAKRQDEGGTERLCSPNMELEIAVIQLQRDVDECRTELELALSSGRGCTQRGLLVPKSRRVVPGFLIKSLSDHYNAPGHLAENQRQFQRAFRRPGDDPSILATELETLARRALMDIDTKIQL